jgi:FkbM family methyltransferase
MRRRVNYRLDISDLIDWAIYFDLRDKGHEELMRMIRPDSIVFDIGANVGQITFQIANLCLEGQVFAFEPDSVNFDKLSTNYRLNRFANCKLFNIALGSKEGSAISYVVDSTNRGMNRIKEVGMGHRFASRITTVDAFFQANALERVDLLKIDTEGFEHKVLLGAESTIDHCRPTIFIEINDNYLRHQGSCALGLVSYLENRFNYRLHIAEEGTRVDTSFNFRDCHLDLIASPK